MSILIDSSISPTVTCPTFIPWLISSLEIFRRLSVVCDNTHSGSPYVAPSTKHRIFSSTPGYFSSTGSRPPPTLRILPLNMTPLFNSVIPRLIVLRETPVSCITFAIPRGHTQSLRLQETSVFAFHLTVATSLLSALPYSYLAFP